MKDCNQLKIYLIVSLDTECDKGPKWRVKQPLSFKNIIEGVPERLEPLFGEYGIKSTYLLSPEILKDDACVSLFSSLGGSVELGTHLHADFIEPEENSTTELAQTVQADLTPEVEFEKLRNLTELFHKKIGYPPLSFRAGKFGISSHSLDFLEQLGYIVDSSVTPYKWWWRGKINFLGAPEQPYYPSSQDFRKKGNMSILEVPITLINPFWAKYPLKFLRRINPFNKIQIISMNLLLKKRLACSWLRPTFSTDQEMYSITKYLYKKERDDRFVLCMMFHSSEATPDMSPYNLTDKEVVDFLERLRRYFNLLFTEFDVNPIGLSEATTLF